MARDPTTQDMGHEAGEPDPLETLAASIEDLRARLGPLPPVRVAPPAAAVAVEERPEAEEIPAVAVEAAPLRDVIDLRRFEDLLAGLPAVRAAKAISYARGAARFDLELAYVQAPWGDELRRVLPEAKIWAHDRGAFTIALSSTADEPGRA